jgi:hypothetical protein
MSRQSMPPGVRRGIRLGAVEKADAPAATTVHVAGAVIETNDGFDLHYRAVQRCSRCGRILAMFEETDLRGLTRSATDLRSLMATRFFATERRVAEGPTANYLVSGRPLAADEKECEFVPAFAWE